MRIDDKRVFLCVLILTLGYMLLITYMSLSAKPPGVESGDEHVPYFNYVAHAGMYFVLSWLLYFTLKLAYPVKENMEYCAATTSFAYGGLLEVLQHFTPTRSFSLLDIFMNGLGCLLFLLLLLMVKKIRNLLIDPRGSP